MSQVQSSSAPVRDGPVGIGGWLVLPLLGLVLTPIKGIAFLGQYTGLSLEHLSTAQAALIVIEIIGNVALIVVMPIVLLVLAFQKRMKFPSLFVTWAVLGLAFVIFDLIVAYALFKDIYAASGTEFMDADTWRELARSLFLVVVWGPYMRNSRRVENTFVN